MFTASSRGPEPQLSPQGTQRGHTTVIPFHLCLRKWRDRPRWHQRLVWQEEDVKGILQIPVVKLQPAVAVKD